MAWCKPALAGSTDCREVLAGVPTGQGVRDLPLAETACQLCESNDQWSFGHPDGH